MVEDKLFSYLVVFFLFLVGSLEMLERGRFGVDELRLGFFVGR